MEYLMTVALAVVQGVKGMVLTCVGGISMVGEIKAILPDTSRCNLSRR